MKNLILTTTAIVLFAGGAISANNQVIIDLKCNGGHNGKRFEVVDGPFTRIADCDRAAKKHRDSHETVVTTQCSFRDD